MSKRDEQILRVLKTIDEDGLNAGMDALADMVDDHDPAWLHAILFLRPYPEDTDHLDEMWEIVHTVEAFPESIYVNEFIKAIPELCASSKHLLEVLLIRMLNAEKSVSSFIAQAGTIAPAGAACVRKIIAECLARGMKPAFERSRKKLLAKIDVKK